ncbi:MAG TPA: endonuclease/exonuclease/phosphatase family protein [Candidatus Izemoplasmatales bacterium]|nr:endonuclease/exonuclease/phosphatase family protein [Candidatus Izemoplasmatales bacterium]
MKKVIKITLIFISSILVLLLAFVLVLHLFEYRPEETTNLTIDNENKFSKNLSTNMPISILTFNTGYSSLSQTEDFVMDGGKKARMDSKEDVEANIDGIKVILDEADADIYLLQEVDIDSNRSYNINQYQIYQSLLDRPSMLAYNYRSIFVPFPLNPSQMMGKVNSGIVTFSSFETSQATRIQLPGSFPWPVRLANLKRALLISRHPIEGLDEELVVINVHLSAYDDGTMRIEELKALQAIMLEEKSQGNYVVVGGDFNQSFPQALSSYTNQETYTYKDQYALISDNLWEAYPLNPEWFNTNNFDLLVDPNTPTCRLLHQAYDTVNLENNQYYLIDGFIVSDNIQINLIETSNENFYYSDHNPVKIVLQLIP